MNSNFPESAASKVLGTTGFQSLVTKAAKKFGTPLYLYDEGTLIRRHQELARAIRYPKLEIHYALKANANPRVIQTLKSLGALVEAVSIGEVRIALQNGWRTEQIVYTCANASQDELKQVITAGATINADSLGQLDYVAANLPADRPVAIRVNQGIGGGHHKHVITGGPHSKFGIDYRQIEEAKEVAGKHGRQITGLQQHIGSNILDPALFIKAMKALLKTATAFDKLDYIDFGGGFGVPYRPDEPRLDLVELGKQIDQTMGDFAEKAGYQPTLSFEPGRYLVGEAGLLVTTVTDVKVTPDKTFVGVDTGFNQLLRPAMYGSYHHIVNVSNPKGNLHKVTVAGNVCESGDVLATDRDLRECRPDDLLGIMTTGAYGRVMASEYNARPLPPEALLRGDGSLAAA